MFNYANDLANLRCGTWVEISATSLEGYHFTHWSDNSTDSVRQIEVMGDATYIAFFAENCVESIPVVTRYDWILMIHRKAIREMGFDPTEAQVKWYRVVGEPDDLDDPSLWDDEYLTSGYSFTLDDNLRGTGLYYAVMDATISNSVFCHALIRSEIIQYNTRAINGGQSPIRKFIQNEHLYIQTDSHVYSIWGIIQ